MPITKLTPENNYPYLQDRLKTLEQAVPEAFADGKINWDTLREVLGDNLEDEARDEYFGLNWPGKREARKRAATPSRATLIPAPGEGVNEDTTENLFIEGDNLEVLKLLQKSYANKIKMIYIDPPYNTGNDFIYNDNFTDPLEAYLDYTGARGESGELLTTNTRADGRFHSKWLNMMYPRLILARQLLREDGVIFVSIDDNEVHNLRQMMNEIFGEENFFSEIIIRSNSRGQTYKQIAKTHEYIIVYTKSSWAEINELEKDGETDDLNLVDSLGKYNIRELRNRNPKFGKHNRPNLFFPIYVNKNKVDSDGFYSISLNKNPEFAEEIYPFNSEGIESCWRWGKTLVLNNINIDIKKSNVVAKRKSDGSFGIFEKYRKSTFKPKSIWLDNSFLNETGSVELGKIGMKGVFDFPKPISLIQMCIQLSCKEGDIILDFFAGSGTTGHAVYDLSYSSETKNSFILIQIPEILEGKEVNNLAQIGKLRLKQAINNIDIKLKDESSKTPLLPSVICYMDLGFKVYKYCHSNFKQWKPPEEESTDAITPLFNNLSDPLIQGWKKEDLLSEILLIEGFPLTSKITYLEDHLKNEVYRVSAPDFCAHDLFVCLDETIHPATVELLTMEKEDIFVCLDSALSDELKARVQDQFNVHVI